MLMLSEFLLQFNPNLPSLHAIASSPLYCSTSLPTESQVLCLLKVDEQTVTYISSETLH